MSGRHIAAHRRHLVPLIAGVVAAAALVGGAVATVNLGSEPKATAYVDGNRSPAGRADRGERPSPDALASAEPSAGPSVTSSPQVTGSPEATKSPTKKPSTKPASPLPTGGTVTTTGACKVSYYATGSHTANGEAFDPNGMTAANKELPFNTRVRVTNVANGKSVVVRINDRGPYVTGRCIDLARGAFLTIATISNGVINARYEVLK